MLDLGPVNAICYSGYRAGQSPQARRYPSYAQVREDLCILARHWKLIRLYDCTPHAQTVLDVIRKERLDLKVLLGGWIDAEVSNPGCPWGGVYPPEKLEANRRENRAEIERLIALANRYDDLVVAVSAGNEATAEWTDHLVPVESVIDLVRALKRGVRQPVTFCENWLPWLDKLSGLAAELDFISLHTYPVWEHKGIDEALRYTEENVRAVAGRNPGKPLVITEAGWPTCANGRGIQPQSASPGLQARYCLELVRWSREQGILTFLFEAFDEPWKGDADPGEPEKHWGLFTEGRKPKPAAVALFPGELERTG